MRQFTESASQSTELVEAGSGARSQRGKWKISPPHKTKRHPECGSLEYEEEKQGDRKNEPVSLKENQDRDVPGGEESGSRRRELSLCQTLVISEMRLI